MHVIRSISLAWSRIYLANRKQYISLGHDLQTGTQNILCGTVVFLLYVNDLPNSLVLNPIMFANDTNLFFEHTDLRILLSIVNEKLNKIYEWFKADKLSLNAEKICSIYKTSKTDES